MKMLIAIFILVAICQAQYIELGEAYFEVEETQYSFEQFVKGFVAGIGENQDPNKLNNCLKGGESIMMRIREAFLMMKTINLQNAAKGLKALFEAHMSIFQQLTPCMADFKIMQNMFTLLKRANIRFVVMKIMKHPAPFLVYIRTAIECFHKKDSFCVGKSTGGFMSLLLFDKYAGLYEELDEAKLDFKIFTQGFLEGIGEKENVEKLKDCLKNGDRVMDNYHRSLNISRIISFKHLFQGVSLMVNNTKTFLNNLRPCAKDFQRIFLLMKGIESTDLKKLIENLIKVPEIFRRHVFNALSCYKKNDSKCIGKELGAILRSLFIPRILEFDPSYDFFKGFFMGIHEVRTIEDFKLCLKRADPFINNMIEGIHLIRRINFISFVKGTMIFLRSFHHFYMLMKPCLMRYTEIRRLIMALTRLNKNKLINRLIAYPLPIALDIAEFIRAYVNKDYGKMGLNLGDIMYRLLILDLMNIEEDFSLIEKELN